MKENNLEELDLHKLTWLVIGISLAGLPHWSRLPAWIPVLHLGIMFMRLYIPFRHPYFWSKRQDLINLLRIIIMIGGVVGIYISYGALTGRDVGIALLIMLAGLKILESKNKRDFYVNAYLGYFLVITNFFYTQTIPTAIYMLFVTIVMTNGLLTFNDTEKYLSIKDCFKSSTIMILQSMPILLVLFILFPRINGPLWGLPADAYSGITGIDDQMTPGTISKLVQSREVAFRVTFADEIPKQSELYWRGPVLWQTDGRKWTVGQANTTRRPSPISFNGDSTQYELTIEPTNKRWLFGLEMISEAPEKTYLTHDHQLKAAEPIRSRKAFKLTSYSNYYLGKKEEDNFERALFIPEQSHKQTKQLGQELRKKYKQPELIVNATLEWLKNENFVYTLRPPLISGDMVDEFLFNTRQGFCEHYAAAFTVIMRSAGIPARVVTGYLGGEINPLGNYLIVRQYDAHAWTEVWLDDRGWTRVDPTSVISPIRINEGIESALPDAVIDIPLNLRNSSFVQLWQSLSNTVDMVNYQWAQWVLGYGPERQQFLLQRLGFSSVNWKELTFVLFVFLGTIIIIIAIYLFKKTPKNSDLAKKYYDIFCKKIARTGLPRKPHEGPVDFAHRIINIRKEIKNDVQYITNLYILVRYQSNRNKLSQLKTAIKLFNPNKPTVVTNN